MAAIFLLLSDAHGQNRCTKEMANPAIFEASGPGVSFSVAWMKILSHFYSVADLGVPVILPSLN